MTHVHWVEFSAFVAGEIATLVLPHWFLPRIIGAQSPDTVRPETSCAYWGLVGSLQGVLYFALGVANVWAQGMDQILPWMALVSGFSLGGFGLFYWAWKEKILLSEAGLEFYYVFRKPKQVGWSDIAKLKKNWLGYIVVKLISGKAFLVPESYQNSLLLLKAANDRRVLIEGYDLGNESQS
jgi:hypothetical protein